MTDVEEMRPGRRVMSNNNYNNPYAAIPEPPIRPRYHPINLLQRSFWMGGSLYILHRMDTYTRIMKSPKINHEWFKIGLGATIALLFLKAYVEIYTGKVQKKEISYKSIPQLTHAAILLLLGSDMAFHMALSPEFGGPNTMFIMFLIGAFIFNFCLMFPTTIQNLVAFVLLTFFLQEYQ